MTVVTILFLAFFAWKLWNLRNQKTATTIEAKDLLDEPLSLGEVIKKELGKILKKEYPPARTAGRFRSTAQERSGAPSLSIQMLPPEMNKNILVPSFTKPDIIYQVNPFEQTCACPDFQYRRKRYRKGRPLRLCKHIAKVNQAVNIFLSLCALVMLMRSYPVMN